MSAKRHIIAMGGGGFSMEPDNPALDLYVLAQARAARPRVCFFPHATDDATRYARNFYHAFTRLDCRPTYLSLFDPPTADLEGFVMAQDVIYVGGGNTKTMLAVWREWDMDRILRQAYASGIVLAGISAGANCWFEQCTTDSIPGALTMLPCLGFLPGSFSPHYDGEANRRPTLHAMLQRDAIMAGYAAEDYVAMHFIDDELHTVVSSRPTSKAYRVEKVGETVSETPLETRYLS